MNIDKTKVEYVVGIDLGHGETSAALCPLQWDTDASQWESPTDITLEGNNKVVPSAITLLPNGQAFIGSKAFEPDILKKAEVHVCFKKRPKSFQGKDEQLMIRFMKEVYVLIRNNTTGTLSDGNHIVYIATPSGWDKAAQNLYKLMAEKAGLPIFDVTKESRAAFVHGMNKVNSGLSQKAHQGAIVFDMGSSTLDFTYLNNAKGSEPIDFGYDCGASFIENYLYQQQHDKGNLSEFEAKYPELKDYIKFLARETKERVYCNPDMKVKVTKDFEDLVDDDELEGKVRFAFQPGELNQLLDRVGYIRQIENAMRDFIDNHINHAPIYGVFLTGGASRMDFIKPIVAKCFNLSEQAIACDQDPSLTISQGVAEVARMDLRTGGADESLGAMIDELANDTCIYDTFTNNFSYALLDEVTDIMADVITGFRDYKEDISLNVLQGSLEDAVSDSIKEFTPRTTEFITAAIDEHMGEIKNKIENIVAVYSKQGVNITMPQLNVSANVKMDSNMSGVIDTISSTIAAQSSDWTGAITAGAIGGAIALILGGPITWLVGIGAFIGKLFFGKSEEEKKEEAMYEPLDASQRQQVFNSIAEQWEQIKKDVDNSIRDQVTNNQQLKNSVTNATRQLLNAYKQELKNARILID